MNEYGSQGLITYVCVHNNIKGLLVVSAVFCIEGALFGGRRSLDKVQAS